VAPIRIGDIGGWTDTWFARQGAVFNIAVYPYVEVQIQRRSHAETDKRVTIHVENFGDIYSLDPEQVTYDKHPLIEAAIDVMSAPPDSSFHINIFSEAPPGASTGTSAAVSVALIGALDALTAGRLTPHETAALAHSLETERLGLQCGIQDQLASAYGGINYIQMHAFPHAAVSAIHIPNAVWWELERRLAVIYIGAPHSSSAVHQKVIADLGDNPENDARLQRLRELAAEAKNALYAADFVRLGRIMDENTRVQRALHKALVCDAFEEIIGICRDFGALGAKVNGAGGDGGSLTVLTDGDAARKRELVAAIQKRGYRVLRIYLSRHGLRVWQAHPVHAGNG
jgi:D-glycero-alpha-D-manno-heptose-7-phosphate kinase